MKLISDLDSGILDFYLISDRARRRILPGRVYEIIETDNHEQVQTLSVDQYSRRSYEFFVQSAAIGRRNYGICAAPLCDVHEAHQEF